MAPARSLAGLRPGDLAFGPIRGGAGLLVSAGQLMLGEGFRVGRLDVRHVFVVTDSPQDGTVQLVEAEPGGASSVWMEIGGNGVNASRWTGDYAYVRLPEDYPGQADDAAAIAKAMIGTPYSFASYAALAAWRMGWKTPRLEKWIGRREPLIQIRESLRVNLPREAICSVLADQAWSLTGKKIMQGVAHQCVTPGALAARLLEDDANVWSWPGRVTA
jgi:hypothetical protein